MNIGVPEFTIILLFIALAVVPFVLAIVLIKYLRGRDGTPPP
jgi:hypothetical protein